MFGSSSLPHCSGGTRFIGVYLARQLVEAGHEVTLLTRGKKPVTFQILDDTDQGFEQYKSAVKHIAADRTDADALKQQLSGAGFQGNNKYYHTFILPTHITRHSRLNPSVALHRIWADRVSRNPSIFKLYFVREVRYDEGFRNLGCFCNLHR